jgi:hypothetical protein
VFALLEGGAGDALQTLGVVGEFASISALRAAKTSRAVLVLARRGMAISFVRDAIQALFAPAAKRNKHSLR